MKIEIPKEDANYMYDIIHRIIDEVGPRMPCSPAEAKSAEIVKAELDKTCDSAHIEAFTCHPRAFLGWLRPVALMVLASFACYFFLMPVIPLVAAILAVSLNIISLIILWFEFFNYDEFKDPLFKEKPSQNVVGIMKPKGEVKDILIFSGHHDSALQFNLLRYLKHGYFIIIFLALVVFVVWIVLSVLNLIATIFILNFAFLGGMAFKWFLIGIAPLIGLLLFVWPGERANTVPGAIDNLSAVAVVLGLGRYLQKHREIIPEGMEIRLVSFGCEEAGLRGAYRYVAAHLDELKQHNTVNFNMDGISSADGCGIFSNEPTTRTHHSKEVVEKVEKVAELVGVPINNFGDSILERLGGLLSGGTDAAAFSKVKLKAVSLSSGRISQFPYFYHQPTDTLDRIERGSLELALKVCIGYILNEAESNI